jgi:hypothetical protein
MRPGGMGSGCENVEENKARIKARQNKAKRKIKSFETGFEK